jgi:hypothetical protein
MPLYFLFDSAFSLWMLVDAIGRPGVRRYWYWVILLPFGEWVYFFKFKIHDPELAWLKAPFRSLLEEPPSIEELRFRAEQAPSLANKVALAQALHDTERFAEAAREFEEVLEHDESSRDALYGLGLSRIGAREYESAISPLEQLIGVDPPFAEYDGFAKLAHAYSELGKNEKAVALLRRLVQSNPRLAHRIAYAYYLGAAQRRDEARAELETALREYEFAPKYVKRTQRALARRAHEMLRELSEPS